MVPSGAIVRDQVGASTWGREIAEVCGKDSGAASKTCGFSMDYYETKLPGVLEIRIEPKPDERDSFARTWCQKEFEEHGLNSRLVQCGLSFNTRKGNRRSNLSRIGCT
jgi:dTDP-4-dehydrorhamnose 3,5-epimerase